MEEIRLNLGCSDRHLPGYINIDRVKPADMIMDLAWPWNFEESSVSEILAYDIIEHLPDKILTMNQAWRALKPGGLLDIDVPTTDGRGAWQDPTHVSYWNRNSFFYFTDGDPNRERFCEAYKIRARFQVIDEKTTGYPDSVVKLRIKLRAVK